MIQDLINQGASIQVNMSANDLRAFGLSLLSEYAAQEAKRKEQEQAEETFLTPSQVCTLLGVNRSTLWRWAKDGYLTPIALGGRGRYKLSTINKIAEERA